MRKFLFLLLLLLLCVLSASAEDSTALTLEELPNVIRPGKAISISFGVPETCEVTIFLTDASGSRVSTVIENLTVTAGSNVLWWNGSYNSIFTPAGSYRLTLHALGQEVSVPVTVGEMAPYLGNIFFRPNVASRHLEVDFYASVDGLLTVGAWTDGVWSLVSSMQVSAGENAYCWHYDSASAHTTALTLTLTDATGFSSNEEHVPVDPVQLGLLPMETRLPGDNPPALEPAQPTPAAPDAHLPGDAPVGAGPQLPQVDGQAQLQEDTALPGESAENSMSGELPEDPDPVPDPAPTTALPIEIPLEVSMDHPAGDVTLLPADSAATENTVFTPAHGSPFQGQDTSLNYWTLPMDITDEEAVWEMLMQPMTVVSGDNRAQAVLYEAPDEDSKPVGVVTCASQGLHVLETLDNGWSLVECYSSSFHDSSVKAWNMLVQGYIKTSRLSTVEPQDSYAMVVDKLTQRLYLFKDGKLLSTLLISTGIANERQPYNETRSGEFFIISPTGGFWSDNMFCPRALRFNDGDLLHEVPYVSRGDDKIYSVTEPYLGEKASHGCIRVQRKKTPEGISMAWLWDNRKMKTKIVIWEDWQGRQIEIPGDDFPLYYNPNGGEYYHSQATCYSYQSNKKTMTAFTYGELDTGDFADLERCEYCAPVERRAVLEAINELYAPGGDHDPVMTQARQKYLNGEYDGD